jgi:hypothetical protein
MSDERRLRVFENRVLRRVFGSKRNEVTGEWRKLHNEELSDLNSLPNIVRVVKSRRMHILSTIHGQNHIKFICVLVFTVFCIVCTVVFVLFLLCIFILICSVCTSVRTTATE